MSRKFQVPFLLIGLLLLVGMGGRGRMGGVAELKPEIRLKLYNEAIEHYEKAKAFYEAGDPKRSLGELEKATRVVRAFPEAYDLGRKIYQELGRPEKAAREEEFFRQYEGDKGASLVRLREAVHRELEQRQRSAPPPDIPFLPALLVSGFLAGIFLFGMAFEYRRLTQSSGGKGASKSIYLEAFPEEGEEEMVASGFFKLCVLLLPAPLLFLLLLLLGFRHASELFPIFLFSWLVVDAAVYLIFFADLSDLGGFRRPGGAV
jgi:tetratricopeptide (TPR) repeat protein